MEMITIDDTNIEKEHICCAITDKKGDVCVSSKKTWMKERFAEGLTFKRLDARGKVFIEYIPAEAAWCPIEAEGYMHINCFWVSGQFAGQGYANALLEECIRNAKARGKCGLTVVASEKKKPFLSEPGYLKHKGFLQADTAAPYFVLYYLPFEENAPMPRFRDCAKAGKTAEPGLVLYYMNQCPHTEKYAPLVELVARKKGRALTLRKLWTREEAQNAPTAFPTYSLFYNGEFVTNEILSEKKFEQFLDAHPEG